MRAELFAKTCKMCQQIKKRKNIYVHLQPKNISELKPWELVNVDLIGPYIKSIRQQHPGSAIMKKNVSLT